MRWLWMPARVLASNNQGASPATGESRRGKSYVLKLAGRARGDQRLDQHRFCPLGKLVVGNLDRIADVDDLGN
jgi:hypothetical protein